MRGALLTIALLCALPAVAHTANLLDAGTKLEPAASAAFPHGKVALIEGTATAEPQRWSLENLEILQPVAVTVLTRDAQHDVAIELAKYTWDKEPARRASTKGTTSTTLETRTAGDLLINVRAATPTPFQLVVWVGDPVRAELPPIAVKKSTLAPTVAAKPAVRRRHVDPTIVIAIGAAVAVAGIALLARRRRSA